MDTSEDRGKVSLSHDKSFLCASQTNTASLHLISSAVNPSITHSSQHRDDSRMLVPKSKVFWGNFSSQTNPDMKRSRHSDENANSDQLSLSRTPTDDLLCDVSQHAPARAVINLQAIRHNVKLLQNAADDLHQPVRRYTTQGVLGRIRNT